MKTKECPYCNEHVATQRAFCGSCGYKFKADTIVAQPTKAPKAPPVETPAPVVAPVVETPALEKPKNPRPWITPCELD